MKYCQNKVTLQGQIALIHLAAVAALFAILIFLETLNPAVESIIGSIFLVLISPVGLIGLPDALPCRCGEIELFGIIFAGVAFALNSYLWAWLIVTVKERIQSKKTGAEPEYFADCQKDKS